MEILSVDEYLTQVCSKSEDYIRSITNDRKQRCVRQGFIKWDAAEAHSWAGPWEGGYALFRAEDHSQVYGLKSEEQHRLAGVVYQQYSMFNFPTRLTNPIDKIVYVEGTRCSRSNLTHQERLRLMGEMTPAELVTYEKRLADRIEEWNRDIHSYAHIERPYSIYMCGNDDCSYTATFATEEEMMSALDDIFQNPSFSTLRKYNFLFTN